MAYLELVLRDLAVILGAVWFALFGVRMWARWIMRREGRR
jgi:hypothetical protein